MQVSVEHIPAFIAAAGFGGGVTVMLLKAIFVTKKELKTCLLDAEVRNREEHEALVKELCVPLKQLAKRVSASERKRDAALKRSHARDLWTATTLATIAAKMKTRIDPFPFRDYESYEEGEEE
jgi:hypothetical protein